MINTSHFYKFLVTFILSVSAIDTLARTQ